MSNSTQTHKNELPHESQTDTSTTHRSSAISDLSSIKGTPKDIRDWLMSSAEDSLANRSAPPAKNLGPTIRGICGRQLPDALASYNPDSRSWKMSQGWLLADISAPSWEIWPNAGMTQNGVFYPQPKWERRINASDYGSLQSGEIFPTPTVHDSIPRSEFNPVQTGGTIRHLNKSGGTSRASLPAIAERFPTPSAHDWKGPNNNPNSNSQSVRNLATRAGGTLNPQWVEWLMGWPIGWTSLEPLAELIVEPWDDDPSGRGMSRTAKRSPTPRAEIQMLGNGQVPQCAVMAWKILTEGLTDE